MGQKIVDMRQEAFGQVNKGGYTGSQAESKIGEMAEHSGNLSEYSTKVCQVPGCGKALTFNISAGDRAGKCPVHSETEMDIHLAKPMTIGDEKWEALAKVHPKLKQGLILTPKELEDMKLKSDPTLERTQTAPVDIPATKKARKQQDPSVERKPRKKSDTVYLEFTLDELQDPQLVDVLLSKIVSAIDDLPAKTIGETKKIVALQDKINQLRGQNDR